MKYIVSLFFLVFVLQVRHVVAQESGAAFSTAGWWKPAGPVFSPEVHADRRVTFRLKSPEAKSVTLNFGEWDVTHHPMRKDKEGVWSTTVGPVAPSVYQYTFSVDGTLVPDMTNPEIKVGTSVYGSVLDVPGIDAPRFDEEQAVPHGDIHILRYTSTPLRKQRSMYVYIPAGYATDPGRDYPVLYLRHGGGDAESSWIRDGRAAIILDNLIARQEAVPMLIVMTNGLTDGSWSGGSTVAGMRDLENELLTDVIPLIETRYRVRKEKAGRAIAGLSMGGGQAFVMGLRNLDWFSYVGEFSAGVLSDGTFDYGKYLPGVMDTPQTIDEALRLLWISCGTKDPRYKGHVDFVAALRERGVTCEFYDAAAGHEWPFWRSQLRDFSKRLFHQE